MNAKRASDYTSLSKDERRLVFFARRANADTIGGGMDAHWWAEIQGHRDAERAVSAVYSRSSGRVPDHLDAWECGECGSVHYGRGAADECCQPCEDDDPEGEGICTSCWERIPPDADECPNCGEARPTV